MSNDFVSRTGIKIDGDASGLQEASKLTRKEMSSMRRVLRETKDETEKIQDKIESVTNLYAKNGLSIDQARQAITKYKSQLPETKQASEQLRQEQARAKQVIESTLSPVEKYQREVSSLKTLLEKGHLTQELYNRAVEKLSSNLPQAKKASEDYAENKSLLSRRSNQHEHQLNSIRLKFDGLELRFKKAESIRKPTVERLIGSKANCRVSSGKPQDYDKSKSEQSRSSIQLKLQSNGISERFAS